jgi:hypothetical protein
MEDLDEHPKAPSTQRKHHCKGRDVGLAKDSVAQLNSSGDCDATALELRKATRKSWQITGHNDDKEEGTTMKMTANS